MTNSDLLTPVKMPFKPRRVVKRNPVAEEQAEKTVKTLLAMDYPGIRFKWGISGPWISCQIPLSSVPGNVAFLNSISDVVADSLFTDFHFYDASGHKRYLNAQSWTTILRQYERKG